MAETPTGQIWLGRAVFAGVLLALIFFQLLPLNTTPIRLAPPDLVLAVTLVWVARRPDFAPVFIIALVFLLCDLLFQRPPGLWAALVVIFTEVLRKRAGQIRNMPLLLEWGTVAVGLLAITVANRFVLMLVMMPQAPLGMTLVQMVATVLAYPVVAVVAHFAFGVTRPAPGAVNSLGHKL